MRSINVETAGLLTARPFNGPGWSVEWQRSSACSLRLKRRRWHVLSYYPESPVRLLRATRQGGESFEAARGTLGLYPARTAENVQWASPHVEALHIHISPDRLARIEPHRSGVRRLPSFHDDGLSQLAGGLYELMRASRIDFGAPVRIMDALIERIANRYSAAQLERQSRIGKAGLDDLLDRMYGPGAVSTDVDSLASFAGVSRSYLFRAFRLNIGITPHALLLRSRLELAKGGIQAGHRLADVALDSGFSDQSHFTNAFCQQIGVTPGQFADWFAS